MTPQRSIEGMYGKEASVRELQRFSRQSTYHHLFSWEWWRGSWTRYADFLRLAWRTDFYPEDLDDELLYDDDDDDDDDTMDRNTHKNKLESVLLVFLPPALFKFASYMAVNQVLRYSLLLTTVGVPSHKLALVVGIVDACLSGMDVLVRLHGGWDAYKAHLVSQLLGPFLCLGLYVGGVTVCVVSAVYLGCNNLHVFGGGGGGTCHMVWAIGFFIVGAYSMQIAQNTVWNIWQQVVKRQANKQLRKQRDDELRSNNHHGDAQQPQQAQDGVLLVAPVGGGTKSRLGLLDFQGKMAQFQVMIRYLAISVAPLTATLVLHWTNNSAPLAYAIITSYYVILCILVAIPVHGLIQRGLLKSDDVVTNKGVNQSTTTTDSGFVMQWYEMMPKCCVCCNGETLEDEEEEDKDLPATETDALVRNNKDLPLHERARYATAFFNLGVFSCATEVVRGGFLRVLCLRVAISTSTVSVSALGHILAVVGATSVLLFWLSDVGDSNRRLSAFLGFSLLSLGHWILGLSVSLSGFYVAAFLFGIGEGFFTGLRELVKQDYLDANGPLGELSRRMSHHVPPVKLRRQLVNKTQIWQDGTMITNSLVLGLVGNFFGMAVAACVFGVLGLFSTAFVLWFMLDTKPRVMRPGSLWDNVVHDCLYPNDTEVDDEEEEEEDDDEDEEVEVEKKKEDKAKPAEPAEPTKMESLKK